MTDPDGGDPVCWLSQVCANCGAMPSDEQRTGDEPERCWRCGAVTGPDTT
jgi:hypothetical protein